LDTIARTVFAYDGLRDALLRKVLTQIDDECSVLCKRAEPSIFRRTALEKLSQFKWKSYVDEMESKAPTLLQLLTHLVSQSDRRNDAKKGDHHYPAVCMSAAVILKERNREMVGLPTYISLLLFSSCAHKQVHARVKRTAQIRG
jgi:hypothetical protein